MCELIHEHGTRKKSSETPNMMLKQGTVIKKILHTLLAQQYPTPPAQARKKLVPPGAVNYQAGLHESVTIP